MMVEMNSAAEENAKPILIFYSNRAVARGPIFICLLVKRRDDQRHGFFKPEQRLFFRRRSAVSEFKFAIAYVAIRTDLRADVIIQVSRYVQDQMSKTISEWKRFGPELFFIQSFGKRSRPANEFLIRTLEPLTDSY